MEKELKVGELGIDYNDTISKVIATGPLHQMLSKFQELDKEFDIKSEIDMLTDIRVFDLKEEFYLTQVVKDNDSVPAENGQYALYPCDYDTSNYYGISAFEDF